MYNVIRSPILHFSNYQILLLFAGIQIYRQDNNYDLVLYVNGKPIQANQALNLPSFQQISGVVLPTGQRIPPTLQVSSSGQVSPVTTPSKSPNVVITIQRTYYGSIYGWHMLILFTSTFTQLLDVPEYSQ